MKPGTPEFNARWKEVAKRDPNGFSADQHNFIEKTHFKPQMDKLKKNGIDLSHRGYVVQDAVWSTSVQYGGNTNVISNALKGRDVSNLSDEKM